jgi:hypothetical protein
MSLYAILLLLAHLGYFHTVVPAVHSGIACLKFNPVWTAYLKAHHLTCSG